MTGPAPLVSIRPLPGADWTEHVPTPALAAWLSRCTPGTPIVVVVYDLLRRRDRRPVPVKIVGSVFPGRGGQCIFGEAASVSADEVVLGAMGIEIPAHGVDLAIPADLEVDAEQGASAPPAAEPGSENP